MQAITPEILPPAKPVELFPVPPRCWCVCLMSDAGQWQVLSKWSTEEQADDHADVQSALHPHAYVDVLHISQI